MAVINRWGKKSIKIMTHLNVHSVRLKFKSGEARRYVGNYSKIARRYGVTRELVRQIAEAEGVDTYQTAEPRIKRALLRKGLKV